MNTVLRMHQAFWSCMAIRMKAGQTLLNSLEFARKELAGASLADVVGGLITAVKGGQTLSQAMDQRRNVFSHAETAMMKAGECGGVMDVIADRIAHGLQDGSFSVSERQGAAGIVAERKGLTAVSRFFRGLGWLTSSGVPILETLDILYEESKDEKLREAIHGISSSIREGSSIEEALKKSPDLFPPQLLVAVNLGEATGDLDKQSFRIADAIEKNDLASLVPDPALLDAMRATAGEKAAPIKFVNELLLQAVQLRASDIHLDPLEGGGGRVRFRVDGALRDAPLPAAGLYKAAVSRIKVMAALDLAQRRLPQDGRIMLNINNKPIDLRVSVVPTMWGERVAIRILSREAVLLDLARIGFSEEELKTVRSLCHLPHGIIVCSGPVGSGKTTLMYAMLNEVDRDKCCVMSVENPVEYTLPGVGQIEINPATGLTFARALRSVLRQDPDVIMVGEMRDLETVELAFYCAISGHLLLTTTHANDAPSTIKRLIEIGIEPFMVNSSVAAVIAQRLIRTLCQKCKQPVKPAMHSLPPEAAEFIEKSQGVTFFEPKGCDACGGTGYRGRIGIQDILIPNDAFRQAVAQSLAGKELRQAAIASGMKPMIICGLEKAAKGITSVVEVCRVAPRGE